MSMPKKFLTVKEVASLLSVTPLTVRNWDAKGKLTAHRHPMNNYRLYRTEDVENLIKELEISKVAHKVPSLPTPRATASQSPSPEPARPKIVEPEKPKVRKLEIEVL